MDRLSEHVVVGCGYSGSGFKHSPASGLMLARLAQEKEAQLPAGLREQLRVKYRYGRYIDGGELEDIRTGAKL